MTESVPITYILRSKAGWIRAGSITWMPGSNPLKALISWLIVWIIRRNLTKDLLDGVPWSS
jgi:hypothetical protein